MSVASQIQMTRLRAKKPQKRWALVSSGTQYINTGIIASMKTRVVVEYSMPPTEATMALFGSGVISFGWIFMFFANVSGTLNARSDFGTIQSEIGRNYLPFNTRNIVDKNRNKTFVNGELLADITASFNPININLTLFSHSVFEMANFLSSPFSGAIYRATIYENDVLIRDFIPVPKGNTDYSTIPAPSNCMWDTVTQTYFQNAGTGVFGIEEVTP